MLPQMFYLLKHLLLLYFVILKKVELNFYFKYVFICFVCVFVHSRFVENPLIDLEAMVPTFLRWVCHTRHVMSTL
jgi:hypothetical protein